MDVERHSELAVSRIAGAIGEFARARILYCLMDGHARTSTELAMVADVSPSTASVHLNRLKSDHLVKMLVQGKHRYYSLGGPDVAAVLERLSVLASGTGDPFVPSTPSRLRVARTCYDHLAGKVGVALNDRFEALGWLHNSRASGSKIKVRVNDNDNNNHNAYHLSPVGTKGFEALGIDIEATQALRRRFACACLDWSERRPHLGGALGAAVLRVALKKKWLLRDFDSRALGITSFGRREMLARFGLDVRSDLRSDQQPAKMKLSHADNAAKL